MFEPLFACLISLKKITKSFCLELLQWCESHLQCFLFLALGLSLSYYCIVDYHHSLKAPFCTPASSVLAEDLVFYTKYTVLCVNCIKVLPFTPTGFNGIFATSISEKVLSLLLSKANTSCVLKISVPPYHLKTWFSISPSFCSFPLHPFILLNQQTFSGILHPQNNLLISCFPFSSHALLSLSFSTIFWKRNLHSQPLIH